MYRVYGKAHDGDIVINIVMYHDVSRHIDVSRCIDVLMYRDASGNWFLLGPDGFSPGALRAPDHVSCPSSCPREPRAARTLTAHNINIIH